MTPAARLQAAIEILDQVLNGAAAEQALIRWARASRFAGSGDRAAVRDHVFDGLRRQRSYTAIGGGSVASGRVIMLGALRSASLDVADFFTGKGYAPAVLDRAEKDALENAPDHSALAGLTALDCPDWLGPLLRDNLGEDFTAVLTAMRHRAPVFLRVNERRSDRAAVQAELVQEGIRCKPHLLSKNTLEVIDNERKISASRCYLTGLIELQDASPQAAVEALPLYRGMRVLDYCAGGGGKVLAMAARVAGTFHAHDAAPSRMRDLPQRARRAGAEIRILSPAQLSQHSPYELVLADVPCSGTGTWRRAPDAKWNLSPERLTALIEVQVGIMDTASRYVGMGGYFAYMTCSLLRQENSDQVRAFCNRNPDWHIVSERHFTPVDGGDGFYSALMQRD